MTTSTTEELAPTAAAGSAGEPKTPQKPRVAKQKRHVAPPKDKTAKKATAAKQAPKSAKAAKQAKAASVSRQGSKTARVLELLKRPDGAALQEIMKATGWQAHSVRGFISGTLGKKMKLTVNSAKREDGERVYSIAK